LDRAQKAQEITTITEKLSKSQAAFLVDFIGMNVEQATDLRKKLRPLEAEMRVIRNTLARRALLELPEHKEALDEHFVGTNALVFTYGEPPATAKALRDFGNDVKHLKLKAGFFDGQGLDMNQVKALADLPSKDVLRGQLLGVFAAPMTKFVRTLAEPASSFVRVLQAKTDKGE
jgi:large subunit ribosomal protein L10